MARKVLEISVPAERWSRERFARWIAAHGYDGCADDLEEAAGRLVLKLAEPAAGEKLETRKGGRGIEIKIVAGDKPADPPADGDPAKVSIWDRPIGEILDLEVL